MGRPHHKRGCLNCGKFRRMEDMVSMDYDLMLKDETSNTIIRVGLCPLCYAGKSGLDLDDLKDKLAESEECFCKEKNGPESSVEVFKKARFVGMMGRHDYWEAIKQAYPDGPKTAQDYLGVIENAR